MKKYLFLEGTDKGGRFSEKLFNDKAEAVAYAAKEWRTMCSADQESYLNDAAPSFRIDEIEITPEQLAAYEADEEDFTLEELTTDTVWDALIEYRVDFHSEPFMGSSEDTEYVKGVLSAEEAASAVCSELDECSVIFCVSSEHADAEYFLFKSDELRAVKRFLLMAERRGADSLVVGVYDTLKEANNAAVAEWERVAGNAGSCRLYVLDAEECRESDVGFDSDNAGVETKEYPSNVEIWIKGQNVGFSVDGLCIDEELEEDPDTDKETVISNWIKADIEYIENSLERRLFFNEKEAVTDFLETVYDWK